MSRQTVFAHGATRPVELRILKTQRDPDWRYELIIGPTVSGDDAFAGFYGERNIRRLMNFCRKAIERIEADQARLAKQRRKQK